MSFLNSSLNLFLASCKRVRYIVPNLDAMNEPTRASALKMTILDEWPGKTNSKISKAGNFIAIDTEKLMSNFPISESNLMSHYKQVLSSVDKSFYQKVQVEVLTCMRNVCENIMILDGKIKNGPSLRLAIGDPVAKMLCNIQGFFLCVEERLKSPHLSSPSVCRRSSLQSGDGVTAPDYICYTLHEQDSQLKLAAVVIEAKTDDAHVPSAVAQLMGYYLRVCTPKDNHTVGLLLTPTTIHIFLFPFTKGAVGCVNAIWLQHMSYCTDDIVTTMGVLCVLAMVTRKDFRMALTLDDIFWPISKDYTFIIQTEIETIKKELEDKLEIVKKEKEMIAMEKKTYAMKLKVAEVAITKLSPAELAAISKSIQD